ncbi:NmrA family NAD(P)-binding protein [Microlunatus sp. GCM10028923]|uniref:NmrA family NAD(P)-binding protein n=1 Tax=Microlunatus sp. GCM10028923 TaxID=3273400 RepID=UPI00362449F1
MSHPRTVLVTGATGNQGGAVARELLRRGHSVRALTRRPDSPAATALAGLGAELRQGDFDDPASLAAAARGADAAYVMGTPFEADPETETRQSIAAVDAIGSAGVPHLVYASVASALDGTGIPHFESKAAVERHLTGGPVPHTVVAPAAFLGDLTTSWYQESLRAGTYAFALPADVALQQLVLADLAAFAALVIEDPERFAGRRIELASVEATGDQVVQRLSAALGRPITYQEIPEEAIADQLGDDGLRMIRFFRNGGYTVDLATLHRDYPEVGWHDLDAWIGGHDLSLVG